MVATLVYNLMRLHLIYQATKMMHDSLTQNNSNGVCQASEDKWGISPEI